MHGLGAYVGRILSCLFMFSVLKTIFQHSKQYHLVQFAGSLTLLLVILAPLSNITATDISKALSKIQIQSITAEYDENTLQQPQMKAIIQEKTKTYILDKAKSLHFEPSELEVFVSAEGSLPYPVGLSIRGRYTQMQRLELSEWIESTLAIPQKEQTWTWE